jgi:hypothetical protein
LALAKERLEQVFRALRSKGETALIPYVTAGDPDLELTEELMAAMAAGGADVIELGVPFSDPLADGPTIQRAAVRSLAAAPVWRVWCWSWCGGCGRATKRRYADALLQQYFRVRRRSASPPTRRPPVWTVWCVPDLPPEEGTVFRRAAEKAAWRSSRWSRRPPAPSACRS